jgi:diaminopropionate ammonia-lyase
MFTAQELDDVLDFFQTYPEYSPTPLHCLVSYARTLGLKELLIKDESKRLGLSAFKILGTTFAIHRLMMQGTLPPRTTLGCATDGSHGLAVAHVARKLGFTAKVYMHSDAVPERVEAIRSEGAEVTIVPGNYDDAVRQMSIDSAKSGWYLISDTASPGYEIVPRLIMAGYAVLMEEAAHQWGTIPDVIIVQAGCGGLACAVLSWCLERLGAERPLIVSCESVNAACVLESVQAGHPVEIRGSLQTIMAGLSCGVMSSITWPILKAGLDACVAIDDSAAIEAMSNLAQPSDLDPRIIAGESGVAGVATIATIMRRAHFEPLRLALGLNSQSRVFVISTEGITGSLRNSIPFVDAELNDES